MSDNASKPPMSASSSLKAPSKIARPPAAVIPKPTVSASKLSTTALSNSTSTLNTNEDTQPTAAAAAVAAANTTETVEKFDLKLNDRVWLNGTKPGTLAFLGSTQFKEGMWAGVILDTAEGKNNGSVAGVAYFLTEENRGVFCRPSKLTKTAMTEAEANALAAELEARAKAAATVAQISSLSSGAAQVVLLGDMKPGDRVVINNADGSVKVGTLRYLGETEFAKGNWAGVELDERIGKNDGSVGNKRYFQCESLFGVFAPAQKVQLFSEQSKNNTPQKTTTTVSKTTGTLNRPTPMSKLIAPSSSRMITAGGAGLGASVSSINRTGKGISGSQESLVSEKSSVYSTASVAMHKHLTTAQTKTAKLTPKSSVQTPNINLTPTTIKKPQAMTPAALHQSLREKELYISQLLKERDFERAEFTKAAQQFELTEAKMIENSKQMETKSREITELQRIIDELSANKTSLAAQCENDRQRIEDLEFQIEEHKMGLAANSLPSQSTEEQIQTVSSTTTAVEAASASHKEDENVKMVLTQLELQKKLNQSHLSEIKLLNKQVEDFKLEIAQLRLGDEVHSQAKLDTIKKMDELESELSKLRQELEQSETVRENMKHAELNLKVTSEELEKKVSTLSEQLSAASSQLSESENQKSEIEFVYEENLAKLTELTHKHEEKVRQLNAMLAQKEDFKLNEEQKTNEFEFALEEHMIQVQDLEARLAEAESGASKLVEENRALRQSLTAKSEELCDFARQMQEANEKQSEEVTRWREAVSEAEKAKAALESSNNAEVEELQSQVELTSSDKARSVKINELEIQLRELNEYSSKNLADLTEKRAQETARFENEIKLARESVSRLETEKCDLEAAKLAQISKFESKIDEMNESLAKTASNSSGQVSQLNQKIVELEAQIAKLEKERDIQIRSLENEKQELHEQIKNLSNKLDQLNAQFSEKDRLLKNSAKQAADQETALNEQIKANKQVNVDLAQKLTNSQKEVSDKNEKLNAHINQLIEKEAALANLSKEKSDLVKSNDSLKNEIETLNLKLGAELEKLEVEKESVQKDLEAALSEKLKLSNEVEAFRNDSSARNDVDQLQQELLEATNKLDLFKERENQIKQEHEVVVRDLKDLLEENDEAAEAKIIEFNELKALLEQYESEIINLRGELEEVYTHNQQQQQHEAVSESDEAETTQNQNGSTSFKTSSSKPVIRLFCDICDQFDLHETEDCPVQAEISHEHQTHTKYTTSSTSATNRAYCDLCEEFGHEEANCPSQNNKSSASVARSNDDEEF